MFLLDFIERIGINIKDCIYVLNLKPEERYEEFKLDKGNNKQRIIYKPIDKLKRIQKRISIYLYSEYEKYCYKLKCVHGFVKSKNIVTNAKPHLSKKFLIKLDFENFFENINYKRVFCMLKKGCNLSDNIAHFICMLTIHKNMLPQGSPTSPIISNMICKNFDKKLYKYCSYHNVVYTRYVDDLIFSCNNEDNLKFIGCLNVEKKFNINKSFNEFIVHNGFKLNVSKIHYLKENSAKYVCGIKVNKKLNVSKRYLNAVRSELHKLKIKHSKNYKRVIGKISFIRKIKGLNDNTSNNLCKKINLLCEPPFPDAEFRLNINDAARRFIIQIITPNGGSGSGVFSQGFLLTSKHVLEKDDMNNFYNYFTIKYYDDTFSLKSIAVNIIDSFLLGEIAIIKINKFEVFTNKQLKMSSFIPKENCKNTFYYGGYINYKGENLSLIIKKCNVINFYNESKLIEIDEKLIKGCSGGPLLDENFRIIGINFCSDPLPNSCSFINKQMFKDFIKCDDIVEKALIKKQFGI